MFRIREEQLAVLSNEIAAGNIVAALRADGLMATWQAEGVTGCWRKTPKGM